MNKTKILIVEDESIVALDIKRALNKLGHEVTDMVTNYDDTLYSIEDNRPDIILMDIHLENSKDGIETVHAIQEKNTIPIIYLTAFSDEKTIQRAIQTNPIGYLIKPFKREELKSTILLGLHKMSSVQNEGLFDSFKALGFDYYFDTKTDNLYFKDMPIKLSTNETSLLSVLIQARGNIVTFEDLEHYVWPDKVVSESALRTLLYRLRSKLEHKFIETTPGFGCQFIIQE